MGGRWTTLAIRRASSHHHLHPLSFDSRNINTKTSDNQDLYAAESVKTHYGSSQAVFMYACFIHQQVVVQKCFQETFKQMQDAFKHKSQETRIVRLVSFSLIFVFDEVSTINVWQFTFIAKTLDLKCKSKEITVVCTYLPLLANICHDCLPHFAAICHHWHHPT